MESHKNRNVNIRINPIGEGHLLFMSDGMCGSTGTGFRHATQCIEVTSF